MQLVIKYNSVWQNSFLDGSNNEPLPKKGRQYIASLSSLSESGNFKKCEINKDTIMGLMCRLIGDQRKLYQARKANYYFDKLEEFITYENDKQETSEVVYLRNMNGSEDQNSYSGMIVGDDPAFNSDYSAELWGVLYLDFTNLCEFILDKTFQINRELKFDPIIVCNKLEELNKLKSIECNGHLVEILSILKTTFPDADYIDKNNKIKPIMLYCSALYIQMNRLNYCLDSIKTKLGGLTGISKRGFTKKDFMSRYTTGGKKKIWGNPYILKQKIKGQGEVVSVLTKSQGEIIINIDIDPTKAFELKTMIENAGVSAFYLGKKGLAYLENIYL